MSFSVFVETPDIAPGTAHRFTQLTWQDEEINAG